MIKGFKEYINEAIGANSMERDPLDLIQHPDTKRASAFMSFQGASSSIPNHWNNSPFLSGGRLTSAFGLNPKTKKKRVLNYYEFLKAASGNTHQINNKKTR